MSDTVRIAGVGIHPFGRFPDRSVTDLGVASVQAALAEAGDPRFDAAFCGTAYAGVAAGHKVLSTLGRTGMPIVDVEAGCASGAAALMLAAGAIRAGQYETVLVFGLEKMPKGIIRSSFFEPWREEAGLAATPAYFALRAQRLQREAGITKEHLAAVVVKNRRHGVENPDAMFRRETSVAEVLGSRVVCEPLHLFMLCSPNEGAAAVVLQGGAGAGDGPGAPRRGGAALPSARLGARRGHPPERRRRLGHRPADDAGRRRRVHGGRAARPRTSTSWNARTPTRPGSCSPTRSWASARRVSSAASSRRA